MKKDTIDMRKKEYITPVAESIALDSHDSLLASSPVLLNPFGGMDFDIATDGSGLEADAPLFVEF